MNNIIFHQKISDNKKICIKEIIPNVDQSVKNNLVFFNQTLSWEKQKDFRCGSSKINIINDKGLIIIDASIDTRTIINNKIKDTNIYYLNDRVGIGRSPLYNYNLDVKVPQNTLMTGFHIGDGKCGFSLGNGTNSGFIPEIIGMGSDENDTGLYFIGRAGNDKKSKIPLIILDGRNTKDKLIKNRPILGITNANYSEYLFLLDYNGDIKVEGNIKATDFILDSSVSINNLFLKIIKQEEEIQKLNDRIQKLELYL